MWITAFQACHAQSADAVSAESDARFKHIASELRCLVCQNQTLFDSTSALAGDLRQQVHEQIAKGESDDDIKRYMVERYGDFILYKPPVKPTTWLLWGLPFVLLLTGIVTVFRMARRASRKSAVGEASGEQLAEAREWLDNKR
jgi:cytochrome c-type biogenesis protein CcmH